METTFKVVVDGIVVVIHGAGVLAIVAAMILATFRFVVGGYRQEDAYHRLRTDLGGGILLGLEFLVAADIIRTVAVEPTLQGVLVLGLIVLIRTFLSMAIHVELEGHWPWQRQSDRPPNHKSR